MRRSGSVTPRPSGIRLAGLAPWRGTLESITVTSRATPRQRQREVGSDEAESAGDDAPTPGERFDRHGIQSAVSVLSARFTPRDPRRRSPRPAPRRRPTATPRAPTRCRHTAPRRPARPGPPVRRCPRYSTRARIGTRPGRQRASSSSNASSDRALLTWSSTSKSLARSGHGRTSASGDGGPCTRRPRTRRPPCGFPEDGVEVARRAPADARCHDRR